MTERGGSDVLEREWGEVTLVTAWGGEPMHRRRFLTAPSILTASGLAGASLLPAYAPPRRLRIRMLGRTNFVGPHLVRTALARGHEVTLFNRGMAHSRRMSRIAVIAGSRPAK